MTYDNSFRNSPAPLPNSKAAFFSMILGIIAAVTAIIGVGLIFGLIGLVLGIIGMVAVNSRPNEIGGKGYALVGIITSCVAFLIAPIMLLLLALLIPTLGRSREISNRASCAANLCGITKSMNVYANDNSDVFPLVPFAPLGGRNYAPTPEIGSPSADASLNELYKPASGLKGSPLASVWILTLKGYTSPKQYLCKSDPFTDSSKIARVTDPAGNYYLNFQNDKQFSYSFAYPYTSKGGVGRWWKNIVDATVPIGSDMAPLDGTGTPRRDFSRLPTSSFKTMNSANHGGEGQNIAFSDAHAEYSRRPDVGPGNDNIYTWNPGSGPLPFGGTPSGPGPINLEGSFTDIVVVPARNLDTGGL